MPLNHKPLFKNKVFNQGDTLVHSEKTLAQH